MIILRKLFSEGKEKIKKLPISPLSRKTIELLSTDETEEGKRLYKKLVAEAEKQGTKVTNSSGWNSHYIPSSPKEVKETWKNGLENIEKNVKDPEQKKAAKEAVNKFYRDTFGDIKGSDKYTDMICTNEHKRADVLAHELGHSKHFQDRDGGRISKAAHKATKISPLVPIISIGSGVVSGIRSEKNGKESTLNRLSPYLISGALSTPTLVAEAAASKRGMKMLKDLGASEEYQKNAKKTFRTAYGTYVRDGLVNVAMAGGGRIIGKVIGSGM